MADDVQLTDLEVIQRYSLAVRGATASRQDIVEALRSDLEWLTGSSDKPARTPAPRPARTAAKTPSRRAARSREA